MKKQILISLALVIAGVMIGAIIGGIAVKNRYSDNVQIALQSAAMQKIMGQALTDKGCRVLSIKNDENTTVKVECADGKIYQEQVIKFPFDNE